MSTAERWGLGLVLASRLHILMLDFAVWIMHTAQLFLSHVVLWLFIYLPVAYIAVNLVRHVDTPAATVRVVAGDR